MSKGVSFFSPWGRENDGKRYEIFEEWGAETFVGDNYAYYRRKWQNRPPNKTFASWNWAAFFFPFCWMAYRKMYLRLFIFFLLYIVLYITILGPPALHIAVGVFGNSMYRSQGMRTIKKSLVLPEEESKKYVEKKGGKSGVAILAATMLVIFVIISVDVGTNYYTDMKMPQLGDDSIQEIYSTTNQWMRVFVYVAVKKIEDYYTVIFISGPFDKWNSTVDLYDDIILSARLAER